MSFGCFNALPAFVGAFLVPFSLTTVLLLRMGKRFAYRVAMRCNWELLLLEQDEGIDPESKKQKPGEPGVGYTD